MNFKNVFNVTVMLMALFVVFLSMSCGSGLSRCTGGDGVGAAAAAVIVFMFARQVVDSNGRGGD